MGAIAALEPSALQVLPGEQGTATLRVRNAGSVVDEFTFDIIGDAADWASVTPDVLRLLPGSEEQATVVLRPPRSADATAGDVPLGIRVNSKEDPAGSVVEEGVVTVAAFAELTAELLPRTSQGSRRARHELAVDNRGNDLLNADVTAYDDDQLLDFEVADPGLLVEPGQARFTRVDVRPVKRFWRGPERTLPFNVIVQSLDGIPPVTLQGTMVQRPVLPKWFWKAMLALLALLLLLLLLWYFLLRPTIESAAEDAAAEAASEAASEAAGQAVEEALDGPVAAQQADIDALADKVNDVAEKVGEETIEPRETTVAGPEDIRLTATAPEGGRGNDAFTIGEGQTFELTDIVLQNPAGNVGELEIRRSGQTLLVVALENFRDLDYHFVAPVVFREGDLLALRLTCTEVTVADSTSCAASAYFTGTLTAPAPTESPS